MDGDESTRLTLMQALAFNNCNFMAHHGFKSQQIRDIKLKILRNTEEPVVFRMLASIILAYTHDVEGGSRDKAADKLREGFEIFKTLTADESNRPAIYNNGSTELHRTLKVGRINVREFIDLCVLPRMHGAMNALESGLMALRCQPEGRPAIRIAPGMEYLAERLKVGGQSCDCCGKTREELNRTNLDRCKRCHSAYYCSKECQKQSWYGGHKQACRKSDQIEPGDIMMTHLPHNLDYDNIVVKAQQDLGNDRWAVHFLDGSDRVKSLRVASLKHIRPEK